MQQNSCASKKFTLQGFEEEPLSLELVEEVGVDHEDGIVENVAKGWTDDQELAAMTVWPRSSKQWVDACWDGLREWKVVPVVNVVKLFLRKSRFPKIKKFNKACSNV